MRDQQAKIIDHIIRLLAARAAGYLSVDELADLERLKNIYPALSEIESQVSKNDFKMELLSRWKPEQAEKSLARVKAAIASRQMRKSIVLNRMRWLGAAAALVILTIGVWTSLPFSIMPPAKPDYASGQDIGPGKSGAEIVLPDGNALPLSGQKHAIIVSNDRIRYADSSAVNGIYGAVNGMLTLKTARGNIYQFTLPDGSKVWLNAASTLRFPSNFKGSDTRGVELDGEAYFEIHKNRSQPFVVHTRNQKLTVLGTHFNVKAYPEEDTDRTTLLEGSVLIANGTQEARIAPGQQADIRKDEILTIKTADIRENTAWRSGEFVFNEEPLESIMKQLSRWYNIDVIYDIDAPRSLTLGGYVSRSRPVSVILERMEMTKKVSFRIAGRSIHVSKYKPN